MTADAAATYRVKHPVTSGHTESMLARVTWAVRLAACVLIGVLTFATKPPTGATLAVELVGYLVCLAATGYWLQSELTGIGNPRTFAVSIAMTAAVAGVCAIAPHGGAFVGFGIIAVLAGAADTSGLTGWVTAGIAVLSIEVSALVYSGADDKAWQYPLALLVVFIAGRNRRAYLVQATQSAALLAQLEQLRAEQRHVAVLDERTRIAREIHDVLAHSLGALGIHLQATRAVLESGDVPRTQALLGQAQRLAADGLVDTRRAVQALRGDMTRLDKQLAGFIETHQQRHSTTVNLTIDGEPATLRPEATVALIRTAQEGLVNTAKHAPHQPIEVRLSYQHDQVRLRISNPMVKDAAVGFSSVDGGFGLVGMRERLLLINGTLTAGSDAGWWTVIAQAPR